MRVPRVRTTVLRMMVAVAVMGITYAVTSRMIVPIMRESLERAEGERWAREDANRSPPGGWTYDEWFEESERRAAGLPPRRAPHRTEISADAIGVLAGVCMVVVLIAGLRLVERSSRRDHLTCEERSGASPG
jgi:hypothetical protein